MAVCGPIAIADLVKGMLWEVPRCAPTTRSHARGKVVRSAVCGLATYWVCVVIPRERRGRAGSSQAQGPRRWSCAAPGLRVGTTGVGQAQRLVMADGSLCAGGAPGIQPHLHCAVPADRHGGGGPPVRRPPGGLLQLVERMASAWSRPGRDRLPPRHRLAGASPVRSRGTGTGSICSPPRPSVLRCTSKGDKYVRILHLADDGVGCGPGAEAAAGCGLALRLRGGAGV